MVPKRISSLLENIRGSIKDRGTDACDLSQIFQRKQKDADNKRLPKC